MKEKIPQLASKYDCTGCMACVDACSQNALSTKIGHDGHYYIMFDESQCIECLSCQNICPVVSKFNYSKSETHQAFAAWGTNRTQRAESASGGVFAAMASYVIDHGGIVYGAASSGLDVKHMFIEHKDKLPSLQGSKYTQSNCSGCYKRIYEHLRSSRMVLFSGTGCQVAGLLSYLGKRKYDGCLITVDLVCGGVPSKLLQQAFAKNEPYEVKRILSYRTKETGWKSFGFQYNMKVEDVAGNIHDYSNKRNLITDGYGTGFTNRYSCYHCQFVGLERMSDYTIGDLWGDTSFPEEHFDGLSVIISHNQKAMSLLSQMNDYLHTSPITDIAATSNNHRLVNGKSRKDIFIERKYLGWFFNHCSYSFLKKLYAFNYPVYSPWMIYKAFSYVLKRILK
jgi:coenzyme F420-reducing hydrogenase beta subunit